MFETIWYIWQTIAGPMPCYTKCVQKYTLICLIQKMDEGTEFSARDWPLHVTLVSNFVVDWETTGLFEKLTYLLSRHKPIQVTAADDEFFGSEKQIRVTILDMNAGLIVLHKDIVKLLKSVGAVFDEPQYLEKGYRAHVTVTPKARAMKGDVVDIDNVTIVDMFPHQDINQRKLLQTIEL